MVIDDIKERLRIEDEIGRTVKLSRAGKQLRGLCPFHSEKTPSFFVFPDSQRWKCFGCGAGGDLIDFVMRLNGWTLPEALRELARAAGVELKPLTADEQRAIERRRTTEAVLSVAAEYLHGRLGLARGEQAESGSPGLEYARRRGFTDETLRAGGVGYFGEEWDGLRAALQAARVDLECPAAVALIGFKGDVAAWAERWEVTPAQAWVTAGKVPAMPPGLLIYPHLAGGRVRYLSARRIGEGPKSWNPPTELIGEKQPFYNALWGRVKNDEGQPYPSTVVVEGQACALSLAQWGIPAVALAGLEPGGKVDAQHPLLVSLKRQLAATGGTAVLGLDTDEAGRAATPALAAGVSALGLKATQFRVATWPAHDVNDWLQAAGTADQARALVEKSPTWLETLVQQARPAHEDDEPDEDAVRAVFAALAGLEVYDIARQRDKISSTLKLKRSTFDALLKAARQEAGLADDGKPKYQAVGGRLTHRYYDRLGNEVYEPLCNFTAGISAEIIEDDGDVQERRFMIDGALAGGVRLPRAEVPASEFAALGWVLGQWGARAVVEAGGSTKDHLRAAIQAVSHDIKTTYVYGHLGWREVDGQRVYLTAGGAVGNGAVQVALSQDLLRYKLPPAGTPEATQAAVLASLRLLEVGDETVTFPLWAAMYLAPLSTLIPPSFTIWVFGTTGSLKSTITALAMCHFGTFSYNTPPASWTGTANALEKKAFLVADAPLWIDDYVPQSTIAGTNELKAKVDQLLRDWGNRAGRSRMQANLKLRQTYAPRGLIISTAEQLPPGESIQARLFQVEVHPGMVSKGAGSALTRAQMEDAPLYPLAMTGYLGWLAGQWETLSRELPERLLAYTDAARNEAGHLRMPANVAHLFLGWEMGLQYAQHIGALTPARYEELRAQGWHTLLAVGERQVIEAAEEKPVDMFLRALDEMLAQGAIWLRHADFPEVAERALPVAERRATNAEFLGWYDDLYWYLLPGPTFKAVVTYYRGQGVVFPDSARGIKTKLKEQKLLHPDGSQAYLYQMGIEGRSRVYRISRSYNSIEGPSE